MFLLGTLVPLVSLDSTARDIFQSLVGVIDLFGIYYAIYQTVGKPTIKVLSVLVGWGLSESILSTLLVYWSGARQYEFSWEYFNLSIEQNINLILGPGLVSSLLATTGLFVFSFSLFLSITA